MPPRFRDKVVVVTGGAQGIGRAAAVRFAAEGARVVAVDLPGSDLPGCLASMKQAGTPEEIAADPASHTGRYLRRVLERAAEPQRKVG
jgi:NAD(P)-dependent dehydrogenase (short-subunit alcohol dehydrogenase family)